MTLWPVASEGALVVQNLLVSAGDIREAGLIPGSGRSPGGGHDNLFQYSCLENPMDRGLAGYSSLDSLNVSESHSVMSSSL